MMIFLAILGGIFLLLLFLMCTPISISATYAHDMFRVYLSYLFLRFNLSPEKLSDMLEKQIEKKKPLKDEDENDENDDKESDENGKNKKKRDASENIAIALELLKGAGNSWNILRKHILFDNIKFYAVVCSEDAHKTATGYAKLSNVVLAVLAVLQQTFVVKKPAVFIQPDFAHTKSRYDISLRVRLRPIFALAASINLLWRFIAAQPRKNSNKKVVKKI